jgi:hypothetical protein
MNEPVDYAWAAGFVDGEGCIHIHRDAHRATYGLASFKLVLHVVNRNKAGLAKLVALFGGRIRQQYKRAYPTAPYYTWEITGDHAQRALRALQPYLVNKAELAAVALEFQEWYRSTRTRTRKMPEFRRQRAEAYREECFRLVRLHRQPQGSKVGSPSAEEAERRVG